MEAVFLCGLSVDKEEKVISDYDHPNFNINKGHIATGNEYIELFQEGGKKMSIVMIGNYGIEEGIQTYRINGDKEDLERIIDECMQLDVLFDSPEIEEVRRSTYSMLLKVKVHPSDIKYE